MVVAVVNYTKGPAFIRMQVYRTESEEWISTEFEFATDAASLLPSIMVFGK